VGAETGGLLAANYPFPIAAEPGIQIKPTVSYDPRNEIFLVVWLHRDAGSGMDFRIEGTIFDRQGNRLFPAQEISDPSSPYDNSIQLPVAACHEEQVGSWVLAWDDGTSIYGRRMFPDGSLGTLKILVDGSGNGQSNEHPALAYGRLDREMMLVYRESQEGKLESRRLNVDLDNLISQQLVSSEYPGPPTITYAEPRNSFFISYTRGSGYLKEVVGLELAEGDILSAESVLADIPGISPHVAYSPVVDDLVVFFIDGRFEGTTVDAFGQLGRSSVNGINVTHLPDHRAVNGVRAVRVDRGRSGTFILWYDNLFAATQRARYRKLYDDGSISLRQNLTGVDALDPDGAYSSQHQILFTVFSRPLEGGYHVYGKILQPIA